jgi:hypothetical protein
MESEIQGHRGLKWFLVVIYLLSGLIFIPLVAKGYISQSFNQFNPNLSESFPWAAIFIILVPTTVVLIYFIYQFWFHFTYRLLVSEKGVFETTGLTNNLYLFCECKKVGVFEKKQRYGSSYLMTFIYRFPNKSRILYTKKFDNSDQIEQLIIQYASQTHGVEIDKHWQNTHGLLDNRNSSGLSYTKRT